ncbi:MAG: DNA-binding transcriptional LysR family regulator [Kiritimatiellia bacterium]|jgi:DNA-binding transcriptional LysR family regulator
MDLEWISDFLELASTKNFTAAAKNRNRSQPAFSRRIAGLEQWVGASLIDRSIHPFALTTEGEHFRQASQEIVKNLHRTLDECRQHQRKNQDFVKFTALHTLAINYFAEWMSEIHQKYPIIRSTMDANNIHDCVESLQSGQTEFMLSYSTLILPSLLDPSNFLSYKLKTDRLILVSAADKKGKPLFNLKDIPLYYLAYSSNCLMGKITEKIIATECSDIELNCVYENTVTESIKAMAVQGMGICWLPQICIQAELNRGDLVNIGSDALSVNLDIMLYRPAQRLSNEAERLCSYLNREQIPS